MNLDCMPRDASATATLASAPPSVATKAGVCRKRSKPGGANLNMISPKVTTLFTGARLLDDFDESLGEVGDGLKIAGFRAAG